MCLPDQLVPGQDTLVRESGPGDRGPDSRRRSAPMERRVESFNDDTAIPLRYLGDDDFGEHLAGAENPVVVVFGAKNCPPCKRVVRQLDDISGDLPKGAEICYVELPQNPQTASTFGVRYTPTIMVFDKGKVRGQRRVGAGSRDLLLRYVKRSLSIRDLECERDTRPAREALEKGGPARGGALPEAS